MLMSFKDFFDKKPAHRHQHPVLRDPSTRKKSYTVPIYLRPKTTPKKYNDFKKQKNCGCSSIGNTDVNKLQKTFNVRSLPVNKVKGLKRTGVGLVKRPNGRVQLIKTK